MEGIAKQAGFADVAILTRAHRRGGAAWNFHARRNDTCDHVPIEFLADASQEELFLDLYKEAKRR